jgi:SAM-dependent methyltransferase
MQSVGMTLAPPILAAHPGPRQFSVLHTPYVALCCPVCTRRLDALTYSALGGNHEAIACGECSTILKQEQGIWLALPQNRRKYFERFIQDYEKVRRAEGRGSNDPQFYLSLPYQDWTGRNSWQWAIRARTYRYIERRILPALQSREAKSLTVLDLGAGNGWLSYRLATLGHRPVAIDLQTNTFDGLGAAVHYQQELTMLFPRFQAELDRLPFESAQFDCAIFNASFHYSEKYDRTLAEAIRCLRPGGTVVIADSPFYNRDEDGKRMLEERREVFNKSFGLTANSPACREYLTRDILLALEARHGLQWTTHKVWYGLRWACRPLIAQCKRRRAPSQFRIYTAQVSS